MSFLKDLPNIYPDPIPKELTRVPFHRIYRSLVVSDNSRWNSRIFQVDYEYAQNPQTYTRAFLYLQRDILALFEYIEPADENLETFSHKIQQLLVRCCIEIEANFKAILRENIYTRKSEDKWNRNDYKLVKYSHHLDQYVVHFPIWHGDRKAIRPFAAWSDEKQKLDWYDAYNGVKHNRQTDMHEAKFRHLLSAYAALFALLSAQFGKVDFEPGNEPLAFGNGESYYKNFEFGIGNYLGITFPEDWDEQEMYNFEWKFIGNRPDRFRKFDYDKLYEELERKKNK